MQAESKTKNAISSRRQPTGWQLEAKLLVQRIEKSAVRHYGPSIHVARNASVRLVDVLAHKGMDVGEPRSFEQKIARGAFSAGLLLEIFHTLGYELIDLRNVLAPGKRAAAASKLTGRL